MNLFDKEQCMGCGNCLKWCPNHLLRLAYERNAKGVHYIVNINPNACVSCGTCETMCTAGAIHISGFNDIAYGLINKNKIPPHSGCYLGSMAVALSRAIAQLNIQDRAVIFKKAAADINLNVEMHDYPDESYYQDALNYKKEHPEKIVIVVLSSSKAPSTARNNERMANLCNETITFINTSNWFETAYYLDCPVNDFNHYIDAPDHIKNASFVARAGVKTPDQINEMTRYLKKALTNQMEGKPYSIVEMVFPCFYRLAGRPQFLMEKGQIDEVNQWFNQNIIDQFKLGVIKE